MKKILLVLLFFVSVLSYSQTYKIGAGFVNPTAFKVDGTITISEKKVIFEINNKGKVTTNEYELVKNVNNTIYFTDGVMTHYLNFLNENGKKKGFEYDIIVIYNFDKRQSDVQMMYYCKKE
jgi:hypothetical protein